MRRALLLATVAAAALAGCASHSASPAAGRDRDVAAPTARTDDRAPHGRPAGTEIIQIGNQRTFWVEHCPTDSPSPLREQCSLTRADLGPAR
ncbi:MAG TPA: hypothetical protein VK698_38945 [Kofleriaceae bacterium]|nr:hypothetical protein [Kofleriaceae bacterium]